MVISTTNGKSAFRGWRSWHVERFGEVVVFPSGLSPEETLISDFVDHFWVLAKELTVLPWIRM